ncbi:ThiF family adenylyltransferase [Metabacillus fastidiosus]|uniref:ThiF family adenylyltransferase n=1 Tax=Metabacillus fastidiosus TaxID=1458 RepID=UPI003D2A129C
MGLKIMDKDTMKPYYYIVQIGAGANGSHFFRSLCQDISTYFSQKRSSYNDSLPFYLDFYLVDEDKVEKKNFNNQLFDEDDLDEFKVDALRERYAEHYQLEVQSVPKYITDIETLQSLFAAAKSGKNVVPILISMVDNNATRQLMDEFFHSDYLEDLIYIDAAVEGVYMVPDKEEKDFTEEEKAIAARSGFSGQVVIGFKKKGQVWLQPVGRIYDDILTDEHTAFPNGRQMMFA